MRSLCVDSLVIQYMKTKTQQNKTEVLGKLIWLQFKVKDAGLPRG